MAPAPGRAPRTAVALRGERGSAVGGVEELELVSAVGKPQLSGGHGASPPLPHVVLNATADVQELCDSVKDRVPMLLRISGWRIGLAPYQAVSYCTDGLGYTVKVEVEAGRDLQGRPEPAYLQLSIRNDTGPTLFTALMVESIHGLCASLPVLPPSASPEQLPEAAPPVQGMNASVEKSAKAAPLMASENKSFSTEKGAEAAPLPASQNKSSSTEKGAEAAPLLASENKSSSTEKSAGAWQLKSSQGKTSWTEKSTEAAPLAVKQGANSSVESSEKAVPAKQGADSSAGKDDEAPTAEEEATADQGRQSSPEGGKKGDEAAPLIVTEEVRVKKGARARLLWRVVTRQRRLQRRGRRRLPGRARARQPGRAARWPPEACARPPASAFALHSIGRCMFWGAFSKQCLAEKS